MRGRPARVLLAATMVLLGCRRNTEQAQAPPQTEFKAPSGVIKEFRDNFHDLRYVYDRLLAADDREAFAMPHRYVEFWYERLGLMKGQIEDRLAFDHTSVQIQGEPQVASGVCTVDLSFEVPHVERIYLRVPWDAEKRQEDLFVETFNAMSGSGQLPVQKKSFRLRLKEDKGRWWIWEDLKGLMDIARGEDRYQEKMQATDVEVVPDGGGKMFFIRGKLKNSGDRSVRAVHILLSFKDDQGQKLAPPLEEQHSFGEALLEPGYASGFSVPVGGDQPPPWYDQWNKKDVEVAIVAAQALPPGWKMASGPREEGASHSSGGASPPEGATP